MKQTSAEYGRPGGILKELYFSRKRLFLQIDWGVFPMRESCVPKRQTWVLRKVPWGLVGFFFHLPNIQKSSWEEHHHWCWADHKAHSTKCPLPNPCRPS